MDYKIVSFPGLGIGEFKLNPTAFKITENITIEWYAIIICVGILTAYFVCDRLAKRFDIKSDDILDGLLFGLPAGFIGARVWYILGDLDSFDSFMDMISVWNGGLAIYGGVFGAVITVVILCRVRKISLPNLLDLVSIGFLIGQAIGRWGNFMNVEVFGVATNLPWRMGVGVDGFISEWVHPLFLYESIWNLIGLLLVFGYLDFRKFKGEIFLFYMAWYGIGRAWMEPLRDTEYNLHIFGLRINMLLAIVLALLAVGGLVFIWLKKPERLKIAVAGAVSRNESYTPQFDYAVEDLEEDTETVDFQEPEQDSQIEDKENEE